MPIRKNFVVGDHLVRCDETGVVHYRSEMVRRWDGALVHRSQWEPRQPQEYVRAYTDPRTARVIRPEPPVAVPFTGLEITIGGTNTPFPTTGAAAHLFDLTLGEMAVGFSWIVR